MLETHLCDGTAAIIADDIGVSKYEIFTARTHASQCQRQTFIASHRRVRAKSISFLKRRLVGIPQDTLTSRYLAAEANLLSLATTLCRSRSGLFREVMS